MFFISSSRPANNLTLMSSTMENLLVIIESFPTTLATNVLDVGKISLPDVIVVRLSKVFELPVAVVPHVLVGNKTTAPLLLSPVLIP